MKFIIEFEKVALLINVNEFGTDFREFMQGIASEIGIAHEFLKIRFGGGMEIDENYQWPVFKTRYFFNEKITARFDKIEHTDNFSVVLEDIKANINNIFTRCFNEYSQINPNLIQDSSNISKQYIELLYQAKLAQDSKIDLRFTVICVLRNGKIFFHINDYKPLGLEYLSILKISNKSLSLDTQNFMDTFNSKFQRYTSDIFHYRKSAFLSLPYKIRCIIIKYLTSLEDFRSLCLTCNILSSCLYDDYIIKIVYYSKFRKLLFYIDRLPPSNSSPREELKKAVLKIPSSHLDYVDPPNPAQFLPERHVFYPGNDFRPPYSFPGIVGGPGDMYPNLNPFFDPTRFNRDIPDPYHNDPYQAFDRGNRLMRAPPPGGFRFPFDQ